MPRELCDTFAPDSVCLCGDAAPRVKQALDSCGVPCAGDSRFECGGNGSNWYLTVVRLLDTPERLDSRSHHRTLMDDDKTVNALPAKTNVDKTAEEKVIGATKEIVVDDPVKDKVIAEEPKSTYMGCFAINKNSGVLGTHVNCNLEMSNKVRETTISPLAILVCESSLVTIAEHKILVMYKKTPTPAYPSIFLAVILLKAQSQYYAVIQ